MSTNRVISRTDDGPGFEKNLIEWVADMGPGESLKKLTATEWHTAQQRKWYKGPCLEELSAWNGETKGWWDDHLKKECKGAKYLKKEVYIVSLEFNGEKVLVPITRYTIRKVCKKNMTAYIQEILSMAVKKQWPVSEPDPELRR